MKKIYTLFTIAAIIFSTFSLSAQAWEPLGTGSISVGAGIVFDGNDVYAAVSYLDGATIIPFAKYSSGSWSQLGGLSGFMTIYAAAKSGENIYIGGNFTNAMGNDDMDCIMRYHIPTDTWHAMGGGLNGWVNDIVVNGTDVYAGGRFTDAGGDVNADYVAKWDGTSWSAISTTVIGTSSFTSVNSLAHDGTNLYIGSNRDDMFGVADYICRFDGTNFTDIGGWSAVGAVFTIEIAANNQLYIGGEFPGRAATFTNGVWDILGYDSLQLNRSVWDITSDGNTIYLAGDFYDAGGFDDADYVTKYSGGNFEVVAPGLNDYVRTIEFNNGELYIGGNFIDASGNVNADKIAKLGVSVGIENQIQQNNMNIYPNPSTGIIYIDNSKNISGNIEVYDILGNKIFTQTMLNNLEMIDLSNFAKGVYFVKQNQQIRKVILE